MTEQEERGAEGVCEDEVGRQGFHALIVGLQDDLLGGWVGEGRGTFFSERRLKEGCFSINSERVVCAEMLVCPCCLWKTDGRAHTHAQQTESIASASTTFEGGGGPPGRGASSEACDIDHRSCETNGWH